MSLRDDIKANVNSENKNLNLIGFVHKVLMNSKSLVNHFYHRFMYIAPSSGEPLPNLNLPFKWILRRFEVVSDVWSENAALFKRLMKIH